MPSLFLNQEKIGNIKAIIMDKDGTLINSEEYLLSLAKDRINKCIKEVKGLKYGTLNRLAIRKLLETAYGLKMNEIDPEGMIAIASREQNIISTATLLSIFNMKWSQSVLLAKEIFDSTDHVRKENFRHQATENMIIEGALIVLDKLMHANVKVAIMSNDSKEDINSFIRNNKLDQHIDCVWSAEDQPTKPNPLAVRKVCDKLNINPSECALISDADLDLKMANDAKIGITIGFTGGWRKPPSFNQKNFLLNSWHELNIHRTD